MTRVIPHARESFDQRRHAGQRPQFRGEPLTPRPAQQRRFHPGQLLAVHSGFSPQPADRLQPLPALPTPGVVPAVRRLPTDLQPAHHRCLRVPAPKQARGLESTRFQRGNIPATVAWIGHASVSDGT